MVWFIIFSVFLMVFVEFLLFFVGLLVLLRSSDVFVESAVRLARLLGVSSFLIGLTVVAIGTSVPEFAASIVASLNGSSGIVLGNIVGSNIANIGLILSLALFLGGSISVEKKIFEKDIFVMLVVSILFFYFLGDGSLGFFEGVFLLLFFFAYFVVLFRMGQDFKGFFKFDFYLKNFFGLGSVIFSLSLYKELLRQGLDPKTYFVFFKTNHFLFGENNAKKNLKNLSKSEKKQFEEKYGQEVFSRLINSCLLLCFSLAGLLLGAELTVKGAVFIAGFFNVGSELVGFTVVAVGTSLPELAVSLTSIKKKTSAILFGNIIGSNIANILLIGGISSVIFPISVNFSVFSFPLVLMLVLSVLLWWSVSSVPRIGRFLGICFFVTYLMFLYSVVIGVT